MILTAELHPERHHHAGNVSAAEDGVAARQCDQRRHWIGVTLCQLTHLVPPRLVDPVDHCKGQILLVLELVIQGAARVARLARHLFEHQVAVAVTGETLRGRLQQRAAGARAPLDLRRTPATSLRYRAGHRLTYMHVRMLSSPGQRGPDSRRSRCIPSAPRSRRTTPKRRPQCSPTTSSSTVRSSSSRSPEGPQPVRCSRRRCATVWLLSWRGHEAAEHGAHRPAVADPRADAGLPPGGCVGAADPGRPRRLSSAGGGNRRRRPVERILPHRASALDDPLEARRATRLGRLGHRPRLQGAHAARPVADKSTQCPRPALRGAPLHPAVPDRRRVRGGDRQPNHARCAPPRVGPDGTGGYHGQMAVLVQPNGLLGRTYMAAIRPFRHLIVYPAAMREIERRWRARATWPASLATIAMVRQRALPATATPAAPHRTTHPMRVTAKPSLPPAKMVTQLTR